MEEYFEKLTAGDALAASRLMSVVERGGADAERVVDRVFAMTGAAWRIGITGGTGSGKSSLVNAITGKYRARGETVGVVAEDPTSPYSGGAILGDRVRIARAVGDPGVFVRSIASRGSQTGFSTLALELADVLDAFGRDLILLETTGVGQLEHRIRSVTDTTVVVLTPESGDEVQSLKSGLMEIGDIYVVNKSDRPQSARFASDLGATLKLRHEHSGRVPPVLRTNGIEEEGIDALVEAIDAEKVYGNADGRRDRRRAQGFSTRVRARAEDLVLARLWEDGAIMRQLDSEAAEVAARRVSPAAAARRVAAAWKAEK